MKITAAVVDHQGADFKIRDDVELCPMGPDDLQIHMVATGICHSDEALRVGDATIDYPIVLGHEGSGIVEKVGPEVTQFKPGDHVVLSFYACGQCANCLRGIPTQCLNYAHNNLSGVRPDGSSHFTIDGKHVADMFDQSSFTTTTVVRERNAVKVPKELDLRALGPLGCGYVTGSGTVLNTLQPHPGDTIAVFGTGAVGLAAMMAGRISGCTKVIAVDIVDSRLALAKELGATDTINSKETDPVKAIRDLTGGYGVDWAVDTTGVTAVMESSIQALAQGGTTATIAVTAHHIDVDTWNDLCTSDRKIVGVNMGDSIPQIDVPRLIKFYQMGMFDFDKTEKFYPFDQINEANADSRSGKTIKPVLVIDPDYVPGK
ncbi:NAD(P)-dependent alcohol dehydrogenase [Lacticaseibacillus thailandensis]|uniref:Aryl-alcohol dehydrogenase n=1 Tax=Lacticaseibacillus thailandensis DSM 22698 = JCM 13996 TaxID=1423810 RepID=A0A0R2CGW4_9LACO|nr:NAD(P)-dependent alcohol dehydrogenase [Lacticaseibacillus thailandensis]KRM87238.1 aryl-alcohol dehydrogenase [Lacticaseibacillus thailandensis DSM 22698 = JCM 13996]